MVVDLTRLFDNEGGTQAIDAKLDLSDVKRWGSGLFSGPVSVSGQAQNRSGIVTVRYRAEFTLDVVCDRCLAPLRQDRRLEFSHIVVLSLNREENDEFIVIPDGKLDLAELAASDILLELPTSIVCEEACKGLCPVCGKNLNEGDCGCGRSDPDPRLQKLRDLLQDS